ncbi:MAG: HAD-IC family P-type ATPase [Candidatus Micrarchaeota archaeon]|nr:HAD-IC family P-type ATPase [Candidatus Micrarchaeota archaeon]
MIAEEQIEKINEILNTKEKLNIGFFLCLFVTSLLFVVEIYVQKFLTQNENHAYNYKSIENLFLLSLLFLVMIVFLTMIDYYKKEILEHFFIKKKYFSLTLEHANLFGGLLILIYSIAVCFNVLFFDMKLGETKITYFSTYGLISLSYMIGKALQLKYKINAKELFELYNSLKNDQVTIIDKGKQFNKSAEDITKDELIVVNPEQRIPVDGIVIEGVSYIDYSEVTGEQSNTKVVVGKKVYAGGINKANKIKIIATSTWADALIQKTIKKSILLKEAQSNELEILTKTTKLYYQSAVLIVFLGAILLVQKLGFSLHAINLFVVTTFLLTLPLSNLVIPLIINQAQLKLSKLGYKINSIISFLNLRKTNTLILDKTGVITSKFLTVNAIIPINTTQREVLEIAYALEDKINHYIAKAIIDHCQKNNVKKITIKGYSKNYSREIGVYAIKGNMALGIGNEKLLALLGIDLSNKVEKLTEYLLKYNSIVIYVCKDKSIIGLIGLSEKVEKSSVDVLKKFLKNNFDVLIFHSQTKEYIKKLQHLLNLSEKNFVAVDNLEDKGTYIMELKKKNKHVLFIGEGIKDISAIANADVSLVIQTTDRLANKIADLEAQNFDTLKHLDYVIKYSKKLHGCARRGVYIMYVIAVIFFVNFFILNDLSILQPLSAIELNIVLVITGIAVFINNLL